jgi:hypothetical protein
MKIDLSCEFENADGTPAIATDTKKALTLKDILIGSLLDGRAPDDEKVKRYSLYRDVKKSKVGFIDVNVEDVAFLKKIVLSTQSTLVVGQAHEMLEIPYAPRVELDEEGLPL